jgi:3-oxoacyl-[acyl-carrier protein] reductase
MYNNCFSLKIAVVMKIAGRYARQFSRQSFAPLRTQFQVKQMLGGRLRRMRNKNMEEKIACVTGAGKGIGRVLSIHLSTLSYKLACCSRSKVDLLKLENEIKEIFTDEVDVGNYESIHKFAKNTEDKYGKIDLLIINAGVTSKDILVEESDANEWERVIKTNLIGAYNTAKCFIPLLKKGNNGKIIIIGSGLGHRGKKGTSAYSCSKAGLTMLMQILAEELIDQGIVVNELIPGPVNTNIDNGKKEQHSSIGLQSEWYKNPEDILPLFDFLISQPEKGPTGQVFSLTRRVI